jgi:hypothetical protein
LQAWLKAQIVYRLSKGTVEFPAKGL